DEDICVVLLVQLSRQTEAQGRQDKRPVLPDLRDSGELERDADTVLFLYREAYYLEQKIKAGGDDELATRLLDTKHSLEI
ncbi:DnaB-like helicase C-terminal domain-containing protein, partial [Proteus mirabilis]|uniref:DnaB-like helicase C-terminal domain-containing protein n=1 Tax=Proteus mirabilis TaxID=584 RepID=UPI001EF9ABA2